MQVMKQLIIFIEKNRELLTLGIDGHFNINGYKKITEFIYNSIRTN